MRMLKRAPVERGIRAEVMGRPEHLWSIYNKMIQQKIDFNQIYDLTALRIITESVEECYLALGVVHEMWTPIPALFYGYIAAPKPNGYQSLHTKVIVAQSAHLRDSNPHMADASDSGIRDCGALALQGGRKPSR